MVNFEFGKVIEELSFYVKLRARPRSSWSICGSVVEHWSSEIRRSEVQFQFNSSWGLRIFSLCHARDKTEKRLSLYHYYAPRQN